MAEMGIIFMKKKKDKDRGKEDSYTDCGNCGFLC